MCFSHGISMSTLSFYVSVVDAMDLLEVFCNGALVILSAILFPTRSPVASAVFWSTRFEAVVSAFVANFFVMSRSFCPYLMLRFLPMFFAKDKNP